MTVQAWQEKAAQEAWEDAQVKLRQVEQIKRIKKYEGDPLGFCNNMLGEVFTHDVERVLRSVRDNTVTVARSANATGKSHVAARICVAFYLTHQDSKVFLAAAPPLENLKMILWGEIMTVVRRHPHLFDGHNIKSLSISRSDAIRISEEESFIQGLAIPTSGSPEEREAKFSGKHAPHMLFVVDEGDAVPDEVYKGIESCMSGGHVRLLIMFNPRAKIGPVYMREVNHQANVVELSALRHPNVVQGREVIPGAVNRNITVRRFNEWTREIVPGENTDRDLIEVPDFLVGEQATSMDGRLYPPLPAGERIIEHPEFSYMVMGKYPGQSAKQLIDENWVKAAVKRWKEYVGKHGEKPPTLQPIMGVDMAEYGVDSNCAVLRYGDFIARPLIWTGLDADVTTTQALKVYIKSEAKIAFIDAQGVGASVAPSMARQGRKEKVRSVGVKVMEKPHPAIKTDLGDFYQLRDQLWWALREWLRTNPGAMLPDDGLLQEELKAVEYETVTQNGKIRVTNKDELRKRLKRSTDRADALCLTFSPIKRPKWVALDGSDDDSRRRMPLREYN